jgi:multidomain signaling protein FimX
VIQDAIIRLIIVEESANDAEVILSSLRKARFPIRPKHVEDEEDLQAALSEQEWDLLLSVPALGDFTVRRICELIANSNQDLPVIALCDQINAEQLTSLLNDGVRAVIPANHDNSLQIAVRRELENLEDRREKRKLEHLYRQSQDHNKILLKSSRDAIAYVHDGMHIFANPSYLEMFGYREMEDLEAVPVLDLVAPDSHDTFKEFMREYMTDAKEEDRAIQLIGLRADKKHFKLNMEVSKAVYENERCLQIMIREQSDNAELERKLKEQDQLTGLYNRQYFVQLLEKVITKAAESRTRSLLLYMVLDNFVKIRDQVGIACVDPIIINLGEVLKKYTKEAYVARISESNFGLLLVGKEMEHAKKVAESLRSRIESTVTETGDHSVVMTCSIGICQVLASAGTPQNVISDAHSACQQAMAAGGNRIEIYKAVVKNEGNNLDGTTMAKMIESAINENRLYFVYQPIVSLRGETEELYDVYLRAKDAEGNDIPPGQLFSAAEKANLSIHLDKWIVREAVTVIQKRHKQGNPTHLFVKISEQSVRDESFVVFLSKVLKNMQIPAGSLVIEFSESVAISQMKHIKALIMTLRKLQCKIALEHFGMSLDPKTSLTHMDVDYVKLDGSYAKGLSTNTENQDKLKALVEFAHAQHKPVVAEAVEDANSLTVLFQCEMDYAQGHYIQEPSPEMDYDFAEE